MSYTTRYRNVRLLQLKLWVMAPVLMVAACAGSMGHMYAEPVPPPVTAYDGSYRVSLHLTYSAWHGLGTSWCATSPQPTINVANGQFTYAVPHSDIPASATPVFRAFMAPDGSFGGYTNDGIVVGQVEGTHMMGTLDGAVCIYSLTADRV